jgi:group II intron reverse transcriptase/maturase
MNADRNSDESIVPSNPTNKGGTDPLAESAEGRLSAAGNIVPSNLARTPSRNQRRSSGLHGVRETARKSRDLKFTALLHHVNIELLTSSFYELKKTAAVGVDPMTWHEYERGLEDRIVDLHGRIHRGGYRALPSRRTYIAKPDGRLRPLGITSLEDKIVQHTVRVVLQSIYEEDFLGFSYGFRPGRSPHQALDALAYGIYEERVNWILDADIKGFFDEIDRDWLVKFLEHRVGDKRMIRLIQKWLNAGIIEEEKWSDTGKGTPQGSVISPLLANVYLHYVFDQWIHQWRRRHCCGRCIVVRYADDFVIGFETEADAKACLDALKERLTKFGLTLHPEKTRLLEFGRAASQRREREGLGKCETFDFLGFTHICGKTRKNKRFTLLRHTCRKRMIRTLAAIKLKLRLRRHDPVGKTGRWLASVIRGWLGYHAVPDNMRRLDEFVVSITKLWLHQLRRRSQTGRAAWSWERMNRLASIYLPQPKILHPYPKDRFRARRAAGAV